jgi:hypothetical protein
MSKLPSCVVVKDGELEVPTIVSMYDFFSPRTKSITIWSVGFRSGGIEANIAESTGAHIHIYDCSDSAKGRWNIFNRLMTEHEIQEGDPVWAEELCNHWILPDSTTFHSSIPSNFNGLLQNDKVNVTLKETKTDRVDICKVDYGEYTTDFVLNFLNQGYRPGLFWIHWPAHPDESSITMAATGHLQNLGYRLLKSTGNYFLYIFIDECMYEICSWNVSTVNNPMFMEFRNQLLEGYGLKKVEETNK